MYHNYYVLLLHVLFCFDVVHSVVLVNSQSNSSYLVGNLLSLVTLISRNIASFAMIIPEANAKTNARHTSKVFLIMFLHCIILMMVTSMKLLSLCASDLCQLNQFVTKI